MKKKTLKIFQMIAGALLSFSFVTGTIGSGADTSDFFEHSETDRCEVSECMARNSCGELDSCFDESMQIVAPCINELTLLPGELPLSELLTRTLPDEDLHEAISREEVNQYDHVNRLREQEECYTIIIFQNRDGTNTAYFFEEAVMFTDENGTMRDKETTLYSTSSLSTDSIRSTLSAQYRYVTENNNVRTFIPHSLNATSGVLLQRDDIRVEYSPIYSHNSRALLEPVLANNAAIFAGVFGVGTSVRYTPTFNGFKEDIILDRHPGTNRFSNRIVTNGLILRTNGVICELINPETGEVVGFINEIVVYDSSPEHLDRPSLLNYFEIEVIEEGNEYILTQVIDEAFLSAEDTVYPVVIDPELIINAPANVRNTSVYLTQQDASAHTRPNLVVGDVVASGTPPYTGRGPVRALITFPSLFQVGCPLRPLIITDIVSANLRVRMERFTSTWNLDVHMVSENWNEAITNNNTAITMFNSRVVGEITTQTRLSGGAVPNLNVIDAIEAWMHGRHGGRGNSSNHTPYGLMLSVRGDTSSSVTTHGLINSKSHGTSANRPRLTVVYNSAITYSSADNAAQEWSKLYYIPSLFTQHEFGSLIYRVNGIGNVFRFTNIRLDISPSSGSSHYTGISPHGDPHSVFVPSRVPGVGGVTVIACIHTHPNRPGFSPGDISNNAHYYRRNAYLVSPLNWNGLHHSLIRYNCTGVSNSCWEFEVVRQLDRRLLGAIEQIDLTNNFHASWHHHLRPNANPPGCRAHLDYPQSRCNTLSWPVRWW
jgi:hypothetical protein